MPRTASVSSAIRGHRFVAHADDWMYHFDRTGRLLLAVGSGQVVRRGLDDHVIQVISSCGRGPAGRQYRTLDPFEKAAFYRRAYKVALASLASLPAGQAAQWLPLLRQWSPEALAGDEQAFRKVYLPISILPPDRYHALVVQITYGCSYNKCLFCDFYRDRRFHIKTTEELEIHLDRLRDFMGPRIADRSGIFLADGNAFVVPTARLLAMMDLIRRKFDGPVSEDFYTFMDTFTLEHKSAQDLYRIYDHGLRTVYTGLETGSNRLRAFLRKPGTSEEAVQALNTLKGAGFRLGVILLVGVGGPAFAEEHLNETLQALRNIHFTEGDIVFLSPFVPPRQTGYDEEVRANALVPFTEAEIAVELNRWRRTLAPLHAKVTLYSVKEHLYA
ncbi:MAG: radical SAM protein [Alicyclobacillus sp.]|nr:radical SAM protein [Alicyclobacillus sp.]